MGSVQSSQTFMLTTCQAYTKVRIKHIGSFPYAGRKPHCTGWMEGVLCSIQAAGDSGAMLWSNVPLSRDAACLFLSPLPHKWHYNTSLSHRGVVKINTLKPVKCSDAQVIRQPDNYPRQTFLCAIFHMFLVTGDERIPKPSSKKPVEEQASNLTM